MFTHAQKVLSPYFFMSKCSQGNFAHWDKASCKTIKGFWSYLKKPLVVHTKKNSQRVNKTLDARCAPWVFKHFKILFMHLWMLCAPNFVPDIEHFARINYIIFNWEQKFRNKFPCNFIVNLLLSQLLPWFDDISHAAFAYINTCIYVLIFYRTKNEAFKHQECYT